MKPFTLIVFFYSLLLYGCSAGASGEQLSNADDADGQAKEVPGKLSPRAYVYWMDDKSNGLKVEKKVGDFTYMFQYKPANYVALLDLKKDSVTKQELEKKVEEYNELQYYNFRISSETEGELLKKNLANTNDYYGRIEYFSFAMQKDIKLIEDKDTLDCALFHFERVFGAAPYATFVLGFPVTGNRGNKTLYYDDKVFGAGKLYLTIKLKNIKNIPSVIVN